MANHGPTAVGRSCGLRVAGGGSAEKDEYTWSYGSDSGQGCFMDTDVLRILLEHLDLEHLDDEPAYAKMLDEAMTKTYVNTWGWANLALTPQRAANVVAFSSGFGDGAYLTYVGYDVNAALICFATDFALFAAESSS